MKASREVESSRPTDATGRFLDLSLLLRWPRSHDACREIGYRLMLTTYVIHLFSLFRVGSLSRCACQLSLAYNGNSASIHLYIFIEQTYSLAPANPFFSSLKLPNYLVLFLSSFALTADPRDSRSANSFDRVISLGAQ